MRSLSSCFEATLMWRRTERANLEKKLSMRLSQEPCLGVKVNSKRPAGRVASQVVVSREGSGNLRRPADGGLSYPRVRSISAGEQRREFLGWNLAATTHARFF